MPKIKLTIHELKRQKDALKRYERYLPTLVLKKHHLQMEMNRVGATLEERVKAEKAFWDGLQEWIAVLGEDAGIAEILQVEAVETEEENIAGLDVRVFKGLRFREVPYDLYSTPPWIDRAVEEIKRLLSLRAELAALREQLTRIEAELRVTTQRVNLFEKVMIPRTLEAIRMIQIFLSDQQTAAVVRGKIVKGTYRAGG